MGRGRPACAVGRTSPAVARGMEFASLVAREKHGGVAWHDSAAIDDQPEIDMNQGNNRGNYGGGGSDDRASGGNGSDRDDDRNTDDQRDQRSSAQRAGWQNQGGNHWQAQRQQQADSGSWLSHQQQGNPQQGGGSDWQGRPSQQQGGGNDWQNNWQGQRPARCRNRVIVAGILRADGKRLRRLSGSGRALRQ